MQESKPQTGPFTTTGERFRRMLEISLWTNALHDPEELLREVVELIRKNFGYHFVAVWLLTEQDQFLDIRAGTGEAGRAMRQRRLRLPADGNNLLSQVAQSGIHAQWLLAPDSNIAPLPAHCAPQTQAELAVPLRAGEKVMGVLDVQRDAPEVFAQDDVMMLQTLAGQIALALLVAELHEKDTRRRSLDRRIQEAGQVLSGQMPTAQATQHILDQLADVVPYERGALMLPVDREMRMVAVRGFPDIARAQQMRIPIREQGDIFEQIYRTNQPVIIDDVTQSPTWQQQDWLEVNHSWMGVPLMVLDKVIGMLSLTRRERNAFAFEDALLAQAFAGQAAILLESSRLYDQMAGLNDELEAKVQERTEELQNALRTMERLDKTKADFIGVAAHELRTPLTVISGYANMLNADPAVKKNPNLATLLEGILTGAARMLQIINNMLDVTRIDSEVLDLEKSPCHIATLLQRVQREFKESLAQRNLTLELVNLDNLPAVQIDLNLMYKVFYHVVMNAIKYTPDGGHITATGCVVKSPEIGDAVEVEIADTGIGIAPEHQKLIFEKFYQIGKVSLHSSGTTQFGAGGPGLGLAIAKGIVTAHGGKIWAESPGHDELACPGSKFFIQIPLIRLGTGPLARRT